MTAQNQNIGRYAINFDTLSRMMLPFSLRKKRMVNLLYCIHAPIRSMYAQMMSFRTEKEYRMRHSGQVFSLEKVLNDASPIQGIFITDGIYTENILIPADGSSAYASYQVYASPDAEDETQTYIPAGLITTETAYDFIIHLPVALQASLYADVRNRLTALADIYKIAGKKYEIAFDVN